MIIKRQQANTKKEGVSVKETLVQYEFSCYKLKE